MISKVGQWNFVALNNSLVEAISVVCFEKGFISNLSCPGFALELPAGMPNGR